MPRIYVQARAKRGRLIAAPFVAPNPLQQVDLREILRRTPNRRRGAVACAFLGTTAQDLCKAAGVAKRTFSHYFPMAEYIGSSAGTGIDPKSAVLQRLGQVLGLEPSDLWEI